MAGRTRRHHLVTSIAVCVSLYAFNAAAFSVDRADHRLTITRNNQPVATYVTRDATIQRPYFCNVHAPDGTPVTRPHPPDDDADHATMHPGIWLAFGDIDGHDFWRNEAYVRHEAFVDEPEVENDRLQFAVRNRYESPEGEPVCREVCEIALETRENGYLLRWKSTFSPVDGPFTFGDQEEMGLGLRLRSDFTVDSGNGVIRNDTGQRNEAEVWGNTARWCDYSGRTGESWAGITVLPHPGNFRPSWMHARDYGFLAANPFGRNAMTGGEPSAVTVEPGETLTLRYGLYIHSGIAPDEIDFNGLRHEYIEDRESSE